MQKSKTYTPRAEDIKVEWHFINADGQILGRIAERIVKILMGKNKPTFTPNLLTNDKVVVTNVEKLRVTGKKITDKLYIHHTMHPKGLRTATYGNVFEKNPIKVMESNVKGMLPKNKLQKARMADLHIYKGSAHPHQAQEKSNL